VTRSKCPKINVGVTVSTGQKVFLPRRPSGFDSDAGDRRLTADSDVGDRRLTADSDAGDRRPAAEDRLTLVSGDVSYPDRVSAAQVP